MENNEAKDDSEEVAKKVSYWRKFQSGAFVSAALLVSAGQWNDSKELALSLYSSFVENFTHTLQYELIEKINVGNSVQYISSVIGEPNMIKRSKLDPEVQFFYYNKEKFSLTIMLGKERVNGYSVMSKVDDFEPKIPFAETLGQVTLASANSGDYSYNFDTGNLIYYTESQDLGKEKMYLSLVRGYIEYAANLATEDDDAQYRNKIHGQLDKLMQQETFGENEQSLTSTISGIRGLVRPNYYAISELSNSIMAESLLTRFEFQALTKS